MPWNAHAFERLVHQRYGGVAEFSRKTGVSPQGIRGFFPTRGPQKDEVREAIEAALPDDLAELWSATVARPVDSHSELLERKLDALLRQAGIDPIAIAMEQALEDDARPQQRRGRGDAGTRSAG